MSENKGQFNRLLCYFNLLPACLLCVIHYISSSSPHQTPLLLQFLPPSTSANQNDSASLYKTTQTHPQITPSPPLTPFFEPKHLLLSNFLSPLLVSNLSREQKKEKTSKRKQGECSQAALNWLDTWFIDESKKNDYKIIYVVKNVRIPKYLDLEWFSQQGFNLHIKLYI